MKIEPSFFSKIVRQFLHVFKPCSFSFWSVLVLSTESSIINLHSFFNFVFRNGFFPTWLYWCAARGSGLRARAFDNEAPSAVFYHYISHAESCPHYQQSSLLAHHQGPIAPGLTTFCLFSFQLSSSISCQFRILGPLIYLLCLEHFIYSFSPSDSPPRLHDCIKGPQYRSCLFSHY